MSLRALTRDHLDAAEAHFAMLFAQRGELVLDLAPVETIDSVGIALLGRFVRRANEEGRSFRAIGISAELERTLALFDNVALPQALPSGRRSLFLRLGEHLVAVFEDARAYLKISVALGGALFRRVRGSHRIGRVGLGANIDVIGAQAMGIVTLMALLVGATVALQSASQLRRFGANIFVADLLVISIMRELGPLLAAIVIAGRTGSAVAAETATMVITEEVDALRVMGLDPLGYIVAPKALALLICQPLVTLLTCGLALIGGTLAAVGYLGLSPDAFLGRLGESLEMKDLIVAVTKGLVFAWLIVSIGAFCGMMTRGGADAVGRSTTRSVVLAIFGIIATDAFLGLFFYMDV